MFRDTVTGRLETYAPPEGETFGVFVFAGYEPASRLAEGLAELAGQGNIVTDREQRTRTEGVYAAGDVCDKRLRQVEYRTQAPDHPILWDAEDSYYLKFYIFQVCDEK